MSASYPDIAAVAAPLLFGVLWNWCLYGVLVVQLYVYSYNFREDKKLHKLLVYAIFFLETLQTALSGADVYYWFVSGYGDIKHLTTPYATPFDVPMIEALVSLSVQYFFAYRIWVLSLKTSRWLCTSICLCSAINAAAAFTGGINAHIRGKFTGGGILKYSAMTWLIGNTMTDILIVAAMLYHLVRKREDSDGLGSNHTLDHALPRIVRLVIETNLMTTSVGIISLFMVLILPRKNWYTCPTAILGKLYSNALLVSLNNRVSIREAVARTTNEVTGRPPAATFAVTLRSDEAMDTIVTRPPAAHRALKSDEVHERVVTGIS